MRCKSLQRNKKHSFSWPFPLQVSATHQRLVLELTDMAESEQQAEDEGPEGAMPTTLLPPNDQSGIMRDWVLVAAGLERFFFILYTIIFAIVTSVYV